MESYANLYVEDDIECGEHTRISYKQSLLGKDDTDNEHSRNKEEAGNKDMVEENHKCATTSWKNGLNLVMVPQGLSNLTSEYVNRLCKDDDMILAGEAQTFIHGNKEARYMHYNWLIGFSWL